MRWILESEFCRQRFCRCAEQNARLLSQPAEYLPPVFAASSSAQTKAPGRILYEDWRAAVSFCQRPHIFDEFVKSAASAELVDQEKIYPVRNPDLRDAEAGILAVTHACVDRDEAWKRLNFNRLVGQQMSGFYSG